jgi:hypothetical protein
MVYENQLEERDKGGVSLEGRSPAISRQTLEGNNIFTEQMPSFYQILLKFSSTFSHLCKPAISRQTLEHNNIFTEDTTNFYFILLKFSLTFLYRVQDSLCRDDITQPHKEKHRKKFNNF